MISLQEGRLIFSRIARVTAAGLLLFCVQSFAGNEQIMQERAQEQIKLNEEVVKQQPGVNNNTRVKVDARVVQGDGKTQVRVDKLDVQPLPKQPSQEHQAAKSQADGPKIGQVIPKEAFVGNGKKEKHPVSAGKTTLKARVKPFLDAHPRAEVRELRPDEIKSLGWKEPEQPVGAIVVFWKE